MQTDDYTDGDNIIWMDMEHEPTIISKLVELELGMPGDIGKRLSRAQLDTYI